LISIIIPVFNEEKQLPGLLQYLEANAFGYIKEILVVDGGSIDGTAQMVKNYAGVTYCTSKKGRAVQMNAGASQAKAEVLYFLHADSFPPHHFDKLIMNAVGEGKDCGCFQMKFDKDHWWLNLMSYFTKFNHLSCRGGDQSLFVKKHLFKSLNGFNERYTVYEDNELIKRLYRHGSFTVIKQWLITSARLYERMGVWRTQKLFLEIHWKRRLGASAGELHAHYIKRVHS